MSGSGGSGTASKPATTIDTGVAGLSAAVPPANAHCSAAPSTSQLLPSSLPKIIPPPDPTRRRTLVLCFDGTGDQFDADVGGVLGCTPPVRVSNHNHVSLTVATSSLSATFLFRTRTSSSSSRSCRKMTIRSRWCTTRLASARTPYLRSRRRCGPSSKRRLMLP